MGEALAAYHERRTLLINELGNNPDAELQDLHEAILFGDPALRPPVRLRSVPAAVLSPAQLPRRSRISPAGPR